MLDVDGRNDELAANDYFASLHLTDEQRNAVQMLNHAIQHLTPHFLFDDTHALAMARLECAMAIHRVRGVGRARREERAA